MSISRIAGLFRRTPPINRKLSFARWPAAVYAIGDVHGCYAQLLALHREIAADAASLAGEKWIVTLGDHIDRGPDSARVVEHLLSHHLPGLRQFSLMGNHEVMMLDHLGDPSQHQQWLAFGGAATLASYGLNETQQPIIPQEHVAFLKDLPHSLSLPGLVFVHAGIRPGLPLSEQVEDDLLWIREPFLSARNLLPRVIHGHTPGPLPVVTNSRICVDTAAFSSGILTAVRVSEHSGIRFINSDGNVVDAEWPLSLLPDGLSK